MYNKIIIRLGFCDIQNNRGLGKGYQPQPSASADITKTSSNNCLLSFDAFLSSFPLAESSPRDLQITAYK